MKNLWNSFCICLGLYSTIPVPRKEWKEKSMRYALCFFPFVGAVIGGLQLLWFLLATHVQLVPGLYGAVAALIPLLVSGAIHMDGWMDTVDALSAHTTIERRLEILKDPHMGAFGVLGCVCLLLLRWGLWMQLFHTPGLLLLPVVGYWISRCLNALSIARFQPAKTSGLVHTFSDAAARRAVTVVNLACLIIGIYGFILTSLIFGSILSIIITVYFLLHRRFCSRSFGGNTGDLAGFLVENIELLCLIIAAVGGVIGI